MRGMWSDMAGRAVWKEIRNRTQTRKQTELTVSFSPALGGSRKEETTSNIVRRQGVIIAALYTGECLCSSNVKVTSGYFSGTLVYLLEFLLAKLFNTFHSLFSV